MNDNRPELFRQEPRLAQHAPAPVSEELDLQLEIMGSLLRTMAGEMAREMPVQDPERPELCDILDHLATTLQAAGELSDSVH